MRFKKLEICGFKSFANKTTVHFEPGVTAVVGPNGSGKSNIVDGIRWVLGEHNPRDVRAPRLEDIIFNGTDRKAPVSMAEVQLTISNEQGLLPISFTEVTITRRVYRSGESECLINQSPCRLKDIQELLLGTGLGGGTYAIIEQGHIDMILSSKPEERRVVFEEASGVAKYLAKKQETMRRLDEVEEHLLRLADIVSEVRRQVGALERAAHKARQYKSQWEQLKAFELRLAVDELRTGEVRSKALEEQLQSLGTRREELETQKQTHMGSLESCNAAVSRIQESLQALRTSVVECASRIEQHESQRTLKTRWVEELSQQVRQLELEETQLKARVVQVDEQYARISGSETELHTQRSAVEEQLQQVQIELVSLEQTIQEAQAALARAKAQVFEAASETTRRRNELGGLTSRLQTIEAQLARLETQRIERAARLEDVRRRRDVACSEQQMLQQQHDEIERRVASAQQALDTAGAKRHELTGRLHQLREQVAAGRAQVNLLEDLWRRYDGFPETVKTLMGQAIDGLIGPLVDLIEAAPGYEEIAEAALGPLAEALVVRDRQALTRCREFLREQQLGGCRFLVLSDCPTVPQVMEQPLLREGVAGSVRQYVCAEATYQPLVEWLLNDSWIVDDIERLLADSDVPQGRLVSRQGDRWDRRSWRFSGTQTAAHGRLGRKQRWEQAKTNLQLLEQEFSRLEAESAQADQEWQSLLGELESAKGQLTQMLPNLRKVEADAVQLRHEAQRAEEEQQNDELEAQDLVTQQAELRAKVVEVQQAMNVAQEQQATIERSLNEAQAGRETAEQRRQQLLIAKAQVETTLQSLTERAETLRARQREVESERAHLTQQSETKVQQRQEAITRSQELTEQLQAHRSDADQLQEERGRLEAEVQSVTQTLRQEEARRDEVLPQVLSVEQELSSMLRRIQEQSRQLSERTFRRSRLIERLQELYQIDEATIQAEQLAVSEPLSDQQRAEMTEQVQKLRAKLEGIGPVSMGSAEEYDELKQRLEFLQTQQQDLIQARDDLKTSIAQINRTARTQFRETFERIKNEFKHYYGKLFDGGQADLILMDDEDVLECGIDIVARPPGKRLQSISLLSGGERALTAVALLFALFKVRPSPFCILDEIDAPLDEANVDRFTRVLEEFLSLSQFILITHNKKTITKADSLYGVTMEEPGISKILSAKLTRHTAAPAIAAPVLTTS